MMSVALVDCMDLSLLVAIVNVDQITMDGWMDGWEAWPAS